jgi:hypothetical protein
MQNIIGLNTAASNSSAVYFNGVRVFRTCVSLIFDSYCCIDLALHLLHTKNFVCKAQLQIIHCAKPTNSIHRVL